ncbi:unnamed protein product [Sphenostylis stenocarpa]|uniref:Uncharacterized protein n=1 Tax=Sphenostylis stenocarpa TaxID=92480 RepID=A0AA86RLB9_9FABA|nr:unnamed protein product [Sphenostylis stenocarpa]
MKKTNQFARVKCEVGDTVFPKEIGGVVQYNRTVNVELGRTIGSADIEVRTLKAGTEELKKRASASATAEGGRWRQWRGK